MLNVDTLPSNLEIFDSFIKANAVLGRYAPEKVMVSISGGSDSDLLLDLISQVSSDGVHYVFFDTGLEYQATKDHLKFLEQKYGIEIEVAKATMPIPTSCRKYGQPFISKQVSEFIQRLQRHNFQWEDEDFETLCKKYPKCKAALRWWCNEWGEKSKFNISYNKWLKEFMIANPPDFKISNKCCSFAKKDVAKKYKEDNKISLSVVGIRKAEGGARSSAYKNCFSSKDDSADEYRPLFWYKEETKREYENHFNITHSHCYSEYGLKRTGCAGCPFGKDFEFELEVINEYEPKLYKAVNNIFGDSYEYTRKYKKFRAEMLEKELKNAKCKNCKWLETHEGKHICGYMAEVYHTAVGLRNLEAQCPLINERILTKEMN